ncbi:MAG: AAA family ATPase [Chitinophagales bacterium]
MREDQIIKLANKHLGNFDNVFIIPNISLKAIMNISKLFPEVKLSKETLWLAGNLTESENSFVITSEFVHCTIENQAQKAALHDAGGVQTLLKSSALDTKLSKAINAFRSEIDEKKSSEQVNTPKLDSSSFDDFVSKMKELGKVIEDKANQVVSKQKIKNETVKRETEDEDIDDYLIDADYLNLLKEEGDKLYEMISPLNEDKSFMDTLHKSLATSDALKDDFKTEHVVLQDIIKLYNLCDTKQTEIKEIKAKFSLAYLFERLQGKDMIQLLSIGRINEMVANEKFNEGINKIKNANYLKLPAEYKEQLLLPSLLLRLKHPLFEKCVAHYIRYANIIMKADGEISEAEEQVLKTINRLCTKPKVTLTGVKQSEVPEGETLEDVLKELNQLIGLDNIKADVESLTNFLKIQKLREEQGLKSTDRTLHAVFMGPPGTGKTTIARLVARIYKHLGYLDNGHLVETDRAGLVAGYIGQTALRVDEVVNSAIDGVLFIDEAYALSRGDNGRDFGNEAIETLLKRMEDHRKDLAVIVAGYPNEMEEFISSNPGLKSRFNRYFKFNHYNGPELLKIFKLFAGKADFKLEEDAEEKLLFIFEGMFEQKDEHFGNARVARNLFEECVANQANRIVKEKELTKDILMTLKESDIPEIKETIKRYLEFGDVK